MKPFIEMAAQQVAQHMVSCLQTEYPGDKARLNDIQALVARECEKWGQPGAMAAEMGKEGHVRWVAKDPLRVMMLASAMFAGKSKKR